MELTTAEVVDSTVVPALLDGIEGEIGSFTADWQYDIGRVSIRPSPTVSPVAIRLTL